MEKQLNIIDTPNNKWTLYVDGASRGNPGLSGAGIYIKNSHKSYSKSIFLNKKTNNQAEYLALILGIIALKELIDLKDHVEIISDSELLVKQMQGKYKVKNKELLKLKTTASKLLENINVKFKHVLRHKNENADALANIAIEKKSNPTKLFTEILGEHDIKL